MYDYEALNLLEEIQKQVTGKAVKREYNEKFLAKMPEEPKKEFLTLLENVDHEDPQLQTVARGAVMLFCQAVNIMQTIDSISEKWVLNDVPEYQGGVDKEGNLCIWNVKNPKIMISNLQ